MKRHFTDNCPSFMDGKEKHYIIYVDYNDTIPHDVKTVVHIPNAVNGPYWCLHHWDFEKDDNDAKDIICYNSGFGGNENDINAPRWADGYQGEYWLADGLKFSINYGNLKNAKRIWKLRDHESYSGLSSNPFEIAEMVSGIEYCPKCEAYSREYCDTHTYFDDNGDQRYRGNHKYVR